MTTRHGILVGAVLALSACFSDGGPGGELTGDTHTTAGSSSSSDGSLTTQDATTTGTEHSSSGIATTQDDETSATTADTAPECSPLGGACLSNDDCCGCGACGAGTCVADDSQCAECSACGETGACLPAPENSACGDELKCTSVVWGLVGDTCYAFDGAVTGRCVQGSCVAATAGDCQTQGLALQSCPGCLRGDHPCQQYADSALITLEAMCFTSGESNDCYGECDGGGFDPDYIYFECTGDGSCQEVGSDDCGDYECDDEGCLDACSNANDCASGHECFMDVCV